MWSGELIKKNNNVDLNSSNAFTVFTVLKMLHRAFISTEISCYIRFFVFVFLFFFSILGHCQGQDSGRGDDFCNSLNPHISKTVKDIEKHRTPCRFKI